MSTRFANWRSDAGSTLLLTIFYGALALVLILVVTAATSLYLERKRLFTLADGAALAGAESFELADVVVNHDSPRVVLTSPRVEATVRQFLAVAPDAIHFSELALERAETTDGRSAIVGLSAMWNPPLVTIVVPDGLRIEVEVIARSTFGG